MNTIEAGRAYVTVTCNNNELKKGLQEICERIAETSRTVSTTEPKLSPRVEVSGSEKFAEQLRQIRSSIKEAAEYVKEPIRAQFVITAGDIYSGAKSALKQLASLLGSTGDEFDKMSGRTGLSTSSLSEYAHAAQMCGADISNVEGALKSMQAQTLAALNGVKESSEIFARLGIDVASFQALSPEAQFEEMARAIAAIEDPTIRAGEAMKIFGADGQKLLPLFNAGTTGLQDMRKEARELGVSINAETAKIGADFVDATTRLKESIKGVGLSLAKLATPYVVSFANALAKAISAVSQFTNEHPRLTSTLLVVATAVASCAGGFLAFSKATEVASFVSMRLTKTIETLKLAYASLKAGGFFAAVGTGGWITLATCIAAATAALCKFYQERKKYRYTDEAQNKFEEGEQGRVDDRGAVERLKELSKLQQLSNVEVLEAVRLVEELKAKYGDVGISVDAVTGKITGAEQAQSRLNARMMDAKKAELKAALAEAEANGEGDAIERKMAKEEVGIAELAVGRIRGESWGHYFTHFHNDNGDMDERRRIMLKDDENFQKRVSAAKAKNAAQIQSYKAQLEAIEQTSARPDPGANYMSREEYEETRETQKRGDDIADDFLSQEDVALRASLEHDIESLTNQRNQTIAELGKLNAVSSPADAPDARNKEREELAQKINELTNQRNQAINERLKLADPEGFVDWSDAGSLDESNQELIREIESIVSKRKQAIEELRKLADPEGSVDWNDAAQVEALYNRSQTARDLQARALEIDASAQRQIDAAKKKDATSRQEKATAKKDEAEKQVAEFEKRQKEENMTDAQRQIAALEETTQKYKEQLAVLKEIALQSGDLKKAGEIDVKMKTADAAFAEKKNDIETKTLYDAQAKIFERYATPEQKLFEAQKELEAAVGALYAAKESDDKLQIAEALNRLGEAQDKYDSSLDASKSITRSVKSLGGTFDAWQAASLTNRATADKKLYDETRQQTRYLAEISRKIGVAVFG